MLWFLASAALAVDPGAGCDPGESVHTVLHGPRADGLFAFALAHGDVDGDGFEDLALGAPDLDAGEVHVYRGSPAGLTDAADWTLLASDPIHDLYESARFAGDVVVGAGDAADVDGDGLSDLIIGSPGWEAVDGEGAVYIILGVDVP